ncbi:MAG: hypothetical protein ACRDOH_28930 [Streptosporangiaceae bacterium]
MSNLSIVAGLVITATIGLVFYLMENKTPAWLVALGNGIAQAEGFGIPGAIPTTHNNPGDITDGNGNKLQFPDVSAGFQALYNNVLGSLNGTSGYYYPSMTLAGFADAWTGGDSTEDWLNTVLSVFNSQTGASLTADNTLQDVANVHS